MKKLSKSTIDDMIIFLRFRNKDTINMRFGCMSYGNISKFVKKSYDYCRNVCCKHLNNLPMGCC